ncbi:hypothetical protein CRUP_000202 [Coryphaenoides rupestris]|nr:hypothetical protein CRUP_000202 [Coryphaenoides rupestris]
MSDPHRSSALVAACLRTPVHPHTGSPLAEYERRAVPPLPTEEMQYSDYECAEEDEDEEEREEGVRFGPRYRAPGEGGHLHLKEIFFSNQEYYGKLEELKRAHLRTMAELENMYRRKLQLSGLAAAPTDPQGAQDPTPRDLRGARDPSLLSRDLDSDPSSGMCGLRKVRSALELRRVSGPLSDEDQGARSQEEGARSQAVGLGARRENMEKGLMSSSPKEHIKNMWLDFKLHPHQRHPSSSSLRSLPGGRGGGRKGKPTSKGRSRQEEEAWRHRSVTVPRPFHMTQRQCGAVKTRSEVELENAALRRQLDELGECQKKFRASPVPAHVRLPLYEELQEQRQAKREQHEEEQNRRIAPKPFSFLERERRRKEQREQQQEQQRLLLLQTSFSQQEQQEVKPFRARPVPRAVYAAAAGERAQEEQLYRSIKMQMRAAEMLQGSAMPPSMLARSLAERSKTRGSGAGEGGADSSSHRPKINADVPDFGAKHRRFQKHMESCKEVRPVTSCVPFTLRTSQMSPRHGAEREQSSPHAGASRWPYVMPRTLHTPPSSSLCSSLSGSLELLPAKVTDASRKRQEAVRRKALEEKRRAEEEEEEQRERRRRRERKLQKEVLKRAQANDPHLSLSQTCPSKLREFRKQDLRRKKEYQQEIKEIQERVKERPLLLEQVAQRNAKAAVERRYAETLRGCGLPEDFLSGTGNGKTRHGEEEEEEEKGEEEEEEEKEEKGGEEEEDRERLVSGREEENSHSGEESYHYSDDQDSYSDDSEEEAQEEEKHRDRTSPQTVNSPTLSKASDEEKEVK